MHSNGFVRKLFAGFRACSSGHRVPTLFFDKKSSRCLPSTYGQLGVYSTNAWFGVWAILQAHHHGESFHRVRAYRKTPPPYLYGESREMKATGKPKEPAKTTQDSRKYSMALYTLVAIEIGRCKRDKLRRTRQAAENY